MLINFNSMFVECVGLYIYIKLCYQWINIIIILSVSLFIGDEKWSCLITLPITISTMLASSGETGILVIFPNFNIIFIY